MGYFLGFLGLGFMGHMVVVMTGHDVVMLGVEAIRGGYRTIG